MFCVFINSNLLHAKVIPSLRVANTKAQAVVGNIFAGANHFLAAALPKRQPCDRANSHESLKRFADGALAFLGFDVDEGVHFCHAFNSCGVLTSGSLR